MYSICASATSFSGTCFVLLSVKHMDLRHSQPQCSCFIASDNPQIKCVKCLCLSHARKAMSGRGMLALIRIHPPSPVALWQMTWLRPFMNGSGDRMLSYEQASFSLPLSHTQAHAPCWFACKISPRLFIPQSRGTQCCFLWNGGCFFHHGIWFWGF